MPLQLAVKGKTFSMARLITFPRYAAKQSLGIGMLLRAPQMLQEEEGKIELGNHSPLTALGFVEANSEALVKAAEEV